MATEVFDVSVCRERALVYGCRDSEQEVSGKALLGASWHSHGDLRSASFPSWTPDGEEEGSWPLFVDVA